MTLPRIPCPYCEHGQVEIGPDGGDAHWEDCPHCKGTKEIPFRLSEWLTKDKWTQNAVARNKDGVEDVVNPVSFCFWGALFSTKLVPGLKQPDAAIYYSVASDVVRENFNLYGAIVYNDTPGRTYEEVRELMLMTEEQMENKPGLFNKPNNKETV